MILQVSDALAELTTNAARNIEVEMGATGLTGLLERWFRRSFCVTSPHGPSVRRPFCSRAAAHGRKRRRFPSEYQVPASHCGLLTREEGGEGAGRKTNTKRHAARSESKQCRDCNLFLGRKWGCCVFKRGCWSLFAAAGVCACACVRER